MSLSESLARTSVLQASEAVSLTSNCELSTGSEGGGCSCGGGGGNKNLSCCSTISLSDAKTSVDHVSDTSEIVSSPRKKKFKYKKRNYHQSSIFTFNKFFNFEFAKFIINFRSTLFCRHCWCW